MGRNGAHRYQDKNGRNHAVELKNDLVSTLPEIDLP